MTFCQIYFMKRRSVAQNTAFQLVGSWTKITDLILSLAIREDSMVLSDNKDGGTHYR
jgi:hypothetical protein